MDRERDAGIRRNNGKPAIGARNEIIARNTTLGRSYHHSAPFGRSLTKGKKPPVGGFFLLSGVRMKKRTETADTVR